MKAVFSNDELMKVTLQVGVSKEIKGKFPHVKEVYDVHVWTITMGMVIFSAHITFDSSCERYEEREKVVSELNDFLHEKYHIAESTIQIDAEGMERTCKL